MKPTKFRKNRMHAGEVFSGIKTRDPKRRTLLEAERHNKFMDMLDNEPRIEAGFGAKTDPVKWVKGFVRNCGIARAYSRIEEILKELSNSDAVSDVLIKPYVHNERVDKDRVFYRNAYAYLKNNYKRS